MQLRRQAEGLARLTVTVLCGGVSSERAISLESGHNVAEALAARGHSVYLVDVDAAFIANPPGLHCDVVFIALHGRYGEDGEVQQMLEDRGLPFTGSGAVASRVAMDKVASRQAFKLAGLTVADAFVVDPAKDDRLPEVQSELFPVIVKPSCEGSSIGISVADDPASLAQSIKVASAYNCPILVERFITGRELTVGLLDGEPLPVIEVIPVNRIFDLDCKYTDGKTIYKFEHGLSEAEVGAIQAEARKAFHATGCKGIARVDLIRDGNGVDHILEINTIPGMTSHSLVPLAASREGIDFPSLCEISLALALAAPVAGGRLL